MLVVRIYHGEIRKTKYEKRRSKERRDERLLRPFCFSYFVFRFSNPPSIPCFLQAVEHYWHGMNHVLMSLPESAGFKPTECTPPAATFSSAYRQKGRI